MAGITDAREWELAVQSQQHADLFDRLRWSYDSLGDVNLQLGFLYLAAAFTEDRIVNVEGELMPLWLGEGLLARKKPGHEDPFEIGRIYVKVLADRCLVEPMIRDIDGRVTHVRVHDVIRGLGIHIAEMEENFDCRTGKHLKVFNQNECSGRTRILLRDNQLSSLPESWRDPKICALLMRGNQLTEIPRKVIGSMISLRVLDLTGTSVQSLPESVGCLKQLACLQLVGVPIKRLPASLTALPNLQILVLNKSSITELPSDIDMLRCLMYLSMYGCDDLQCLPSSFSGLTSLQWLDMRKCSNVWATRDKKRRWKKVASIADLSSLTQLKVLRVPNNGETVSEGTLGSMVQMETLELQLTSMTELPGDIFKMSKLRRFTLECSHVVKMQSKFSEFHNLMHLKLWNCSTLEDLTDLHKLRSLKRLDIFKCKKLRKFPKEFGDIGAFSLLEIFSLSYLTELEQLPLIEDGAMPMLKVFTMMKCEALHTLPESYLNLKTLQKLRVFGCSMVLENLQRIKLVDPKVEVVTMSVIDTKEIIQKYIQVGHSLEGGSYGESWSNELWLFLQDLCRSL